MRNNDYSIDDTFKIVWSYMPLSLEEMSKIEVSHQVRPYLLCMEKEDYFYAFPCTSKVFTNKFRYQNGKVILNDVVDYKKTLVDLSKIYKLPKENIRSGEYNLFDYQANEIIKKMQASFDYSNYPDEVKEYFGDKKISYTIYDLVECNGMLYNVIGFNGEDTLIVLPVFKYPVNNTVLAKTDGLKYYVDVNNVTCIKSDAVDKYCTQLFGFAFSTSTNKKDNINKLHERYSRLSRITSSEDFTQFNNLEPGMIIKYKVKDIFYKMIVLENHETDLEVLVGLDGEMYRDFIPMNLPANTDFQYEIIGMLDEDRLANLIDKSSEKLYDITPFVKIKK